VTPDWTVWILATLVGASIGSFLNVCIYRWPAGESVISPPSRCPSCEHALGWRENIPVLGWLLLRGRCRHCGAAVSAQYPIIEATVALIWLAAVIRFGVSIDALHSALFLTILLGIAMTDAREMVIPDQFTIIGAALGLALAFAPGGITPVAAIIGALGGYVLLWAVKIVAEKALKKEALGVGDIHMMLFVGAFLGLPGMLLTLMLGSLLGVVIGVPLTWLQGRLAAMSTYLPLGTFLALGAAVAHIWGPAILDWYMSYVGIV
jgi:leader peptidase (prepilin peptidase) / N-methyltransferase